MAAAAQKFTVTNATAPIGVMLHGRDIASVADDLESNAST